jgi:Spy/CpxP family protein refolding chaperone
MIESTQSKTRDIPIWLTGMVLLLCIGGGGWLIMWYMRDNPNRVVEIPEDKSVNYATGNGGRAWRTQGAGQAAPRIRINPDADGIQASSKTSYRAKVGNTLILINSNGGNRTDFVPQYLNARSPEQADLSMMRMSLLSDSNWREHLKLTEEQLAQLRNKVPPPQVMKLDPQDSLRLAGLWKTYQNAVSSAKPAAEKAFLAAVDEIGKKNIPAYKEYEAKRAEAIKAALTPEQIKLYRSAGGTKAPPRSNPKPGVSPVVTPTPAAATDTKSGDTAVAPAPAPAPAAATLEKK